MPVVGDYVLDNGLNALDTLADKIYICSAEPTTFSEATTGGNKALGNKNFGSAGAAVGSPSGSGPRTVATVAITDGSVTNTGTASHWAIVDSANSRLLATGTLQASVAVTSGQTFTLGSFTITLPDQ